MKKLAVLLTIPILMIMVQCKQAEKGPEGSPIPKEVVAKTIDKLIEKHGSDLQFRIERGVNQVANLWRTSDGSVEDFESFCQEEFVADAQQLHTLFEKLSAGYEILNGYFLRITKDLMRPLHLDMGDYTHRYDVWQF